MSRELDLVVWGATGFTGRLVAEYLLRRYGTDSFRWALGGRSRARLETLRQEIGRETRTDAGELPLVLGDASDAASMGALAERTRVVCSTVGPYALYGSGLVAACARAGTHYCDLTGEVHWMRRMIDAHQREAAGSGARIVPSCGFDCIPSDLAVFFLQGEMQARHGVPCRRIKLRVEGFSGGASGGTAASMLNLLEEATRDPAVRRVMLDPYSINPADQRSGPDGPDSLVPAWDPDFEQWTAPFVMAAINTRVVRRTNALLGFPYGRDFRYDEAMLMGRGPLGLAKATGLSAALGGGMAAASFRPVRRMIEAHLPAPGEGPTREQQEKGYWDLRLLGEHPKDSARNLWARVRGDKDPGYGSTSRMLGESAVCLVVDELDSQPGFLTPAAAMGMTLLSRLQQNAGVRFEIEESGS
jgi:short subunit dehydrogenase-like uncharacterized protein